MDNKILVIGILAVALLLAGCVQQQAKDETGAGTTATAAGEAISTTEVDSGIAEVDSLLSESDAASMDDLTIDETTFQ